MWINGAKGRSILHSDGLMLDRRVDETDTQRTHINGGREEGKCKQTDGERKGQILNSNGLKYDGWMDETDQTGTSQ